MARDSAVECKRMVVIPVSLSMESSSSHEQGVKTDINQQILELKKEQEMQKQMLWHTFQEKTKQLELQHKLELEHKYQELREQRMVAEEQKERRDRDILKRKDNCSANASPEVKQILMSFLMNKKAGNSNGVTPSASYRTRGVVKSASGESLPVGSTSLLHPYKVPQVATSTVKCDADFPLRKTASEPNLLKIRLKQSVIERKARINPLALRRHERLLSTSQRRQQKQNNVLANCTNIGSESGPNSPSSLTSTHGSATSGAIQEENEGAQCQETRSNINDLSLFSSPSLPNISLGRPQMPSSHSPVANVLNSIRKTSTATQSFVGVNSASYYSMLPVDYALPQTISSSQTPPRAHASTSSQLSHISFRQTPVYGQPITDAQVAYARLNKQGHRPLGRTQSAPLPLGHPMLTITGPVNVIQMQNQNCEVGRSIHKQQHILLTQKIRQTVLTRNSCEPQLKEEESLEIIDLTDKKQPPRTVLANSVATCSSNSFLCDTSYTTGSEYLRHQENLLFKHSLQIEKTLDHDCSPSLLRTHSSPLVYLDGQALRSLSDCESQEITTPAMNLSITQQYDIAHNSAQATGLAFDSAMLKHACICGNNSSHPEHSGRLQSVWARLIETGLANRCHRLRARKATQEELQTVHTEAHSLLFGSNQLSRHRTDISFVRLSCGGVGVDLDTTWNDQYTATAARMAVGCVVDLALKIANDDIKNGFAIVRPPGHHAESNLAMGFCFFNSVAIAAKILLRKIPGVRKILIVDWDIHHGNGTQQVFYESANVLYMSIHRHDEGNFFPGTGSIAECGSGNGLGFNVNIPWSGALNPPLGDAEYLAAFRTIIMPIAKDFCPDIVLVSAGFDAAAGHPAPIGGYLVSPACFGEMTKNLMQLAHGKVVLALEGGYDLTTICDSAEECVRTLLTNEATSIVEAELTRPPCQNAVQTLQRVIAVQIHHWPCLRRLAHTVVMSAVQASKAEKEECEAVAAMAGLSMKPPNNFS